MPKLRKPYTKTVNKVIVIECNTFDLADDSFEGKIIAQFKTEGLYSKDGRFFPNRPLVKLMLSYKARHLETVEGELFVYVSNVAAPVG